MWNVVFILSIISSLDTLPQNFYRQNNYKPKCRKVWRQNQNSIWEIWVSLEKYDSFYIVTGQGSNIFLWNRELKTWEGYLTLKIKAPLTLMVAGFFSEKKIFFPYCFNRIYFQVYFTIYEDDQVRDCREKMLFIYII